MQRASVLTKASVALLIAFGLLLTAVRLPLAVWDATPRVLSQSHIPSNTIAKRLQHLPFGPITTYYRALTLWDPDRRFWAMWSSQWSVSDAPNLLKDQIKRLQQEFESTDDEMKEAMKQAENFTAQWKDSAEAWRATVAALEKESSTTLLPNATTVEVDTDVALSVPMKAMSALKSVFILESLRTLQAWPLEVVLSVGIVKDRKRTDLPVLLTVLNVLTRYYAQIIPSTVHLQLLAHDRDGGPWTGRYAGVQFSTAPFIAMMDNDDYLNPWSLKLRAQLLRENPDLDYILGGFTFVTVKQNATRQELFDQELLPHMIRPSTKASYDDLLRRARKSFRPDAFESSRGQFNITRRTTFYLGSIVSLPNIGTQWYRMRETPFMDLMQTLRTRVGELQLQQRLPPLGFEKYITKNEQGAFRGLLDLREKQDKRYLEMEIENAHNQDWDFRCHNAWSFARRELYESLPPPIYMWNGEDSAYNFMVYMSGFNAFCADIKIGGYGSWEDPEALFRKERPPEPTTTQTAATAEVSK